MTDHLDLISKLLAQAEGSPYGPEQDAFMAAAQKLASRHSIDLAVARAHSAKSQARETPVERTVILGTKGTRGLAHLARLYVVIAKANDVATLVAMDSTKVYPLGFPSDIDVVHALWASLAIQMRQAANDYLASPQRRTLTTEYTDCDGHTHYRPVHTTTARNQFLWGFIDGMRERLAAAAEEAEAEAMATDSGAASAGGPALVSTALALVAKRQEVAEFKAAAMIRRKVTRAYRGGSAPVRQAPEARLAGSQAAARASLTGSGAAAIGA
mgnify:CR=1 FL=1